MQNLFIEGTDTTPLIDFYTNGKLLIKGRSLPEDVHKFYEPVFYWIKKLEAETVKFDVKMEYINTSSTKKILNLLIELENNTNIKNIEINWFYEDDDFDMLDLGEMYEINLERSTFTLIETVDLF
ncbi:MAG: hypothetical protein A2W99_13900 [Bacteroidetes bacterium GWF2_33_16]|nr:MAG: hypothetical protein A2X00_09200 [Bacteroidetes bacterium GWE2_32_14]OFY04595.1 MAG: hypothetical protein A2W99_13900 [Bacteroidetes bacterium GWF2_33_16]